MGTDKNNLAYIVGVALGDGNLSNSNGRANCLKGLFETDGSVYMDRKYKMANFVTIIPMLANDVIEIIEKIGFKPNMQILKSATKKTKYTIRISKNTKKFIKTINLDKS